MRQSKVIVGDVREMNFSRIGGPFGVLVADCPWTYAHKEIEGSTQRQYDVLGIEELCQLPIQPALADDCILFLWGTWPMVPEALKVQAAWGFTHVTGFPWVKLNLKNGGVQYRVGYWVRGCSEYVLIGRRGHVKPPRLEGYLGLLSPNLGHSHKPDSVHEIAESLPGPYLELFARRAREGWTVVGNAVEGYDEKGAELPKTLQIGDLYC